MPDMPITPEVAATLMAQVFALVRACPSGRVTTYSAIAKTLGFPRGARMIGWIMQETPAGGDVPAQRVVSSTGELSGSWAFAMPNTMREVLESEGILFNADGKVDLKRFGWEPQRDLTDEQLRDVLAKAEPIAGTISQRLMYKLCNDVASPFRVGKS